MLYGSMGRARWSSFPHVELSLGRSPPAWLALVLAAALGSGSCGKAAARAQGFLLVAIDGLRADHVSCLGYDRATTPSLDALARNGVVFTQAYSTAPAFIPAHATLLSGCDPNLSRRFVPKGLDLPEPSRWGLPEAVPRLAVQFLANGFATGAFLDTGDLAPEGGFADGFQVFDYDDIRGHSRRPEDRGGEAAASRLRLWVHSLPRKRPWFAYLHVRDVERSWRTSDPEWTDYFDQRPELDSVPPVGAADDVFFAVPRSRWRGGTVTLGAYEARYDEALVRIDRFLGMFFRSLRGDGIWRDTTVAVVGTHGLQFGEMGLYMTSGMLSVADLHVPWIVRPTERRGEIVRGARVDGLASLVDVPPTLLELAGLEVPRGMHGRSHLAVMQGSPERVREYAFASCGRVPGTVVFGERWTFERLEFDPQDQTVIRQWFGGEPSSSELLREVVYDRIATPYPPIAEPLREAPTEEVRALAAVSERWRGNMYASWLVLQGSVFLREDPDEALVRRLIAAGYLGGTP